MMSKSKQLWGGGGWLPVGKYPNVYIFFVTFLQVRVYKELALQWSFVAIL